MLLGQNRLKGLGLARRIIRGSERLGGGHGGEQSDDAGDKDRFHDISFRVGSGNLG
jgi:hypothetical protein